MELERYWSFSASAKTIFFLVYDTHFQGERHFFDAVKSMCEWAEERKDGIRQLQDAGADIYIIVYLDGSHNIGSRLDTQTMSIAASLGISIDVELFPEFNFE
jgi:hypothetical protein